MNLRIPWMISPGIGQLADRSGSTQQVAGLAFECLAEPGQSAEPDRPRPAVLEYGPCAPTRPAPGPSGAASTHLAMRLSLLVRWGLRGSDVVPASAVLRVALPPPQPPGPGRGSFGRSSTVMVPGGPYLP